MNYYAALNYLFAQSHLHLANIYLASPLRAMPTGGRTWNKTVAPGLKKLTVQQELKSIQPILSTCDEFCQFSPFEKIS